MIVLLVYCFIIILRIYREGSREEGRDEEREGGRGQSVQLNSTLVYTPILTSTFTYRFLGRTSLSLSEVINEKHVSTVLKLKGQKGEALAVSLCLLLI